MNEKKAIELATKWRTEKYCPETGRLISSNEVDVCNALLDAVNRMSSALKLIRESGWNFDPTAIWMQKVAAEAMEPGKFPKQPDQPPH